MSKKVLILTAILLVFLASEVQAAVIHSIWVGGNQGRWDDPNNWNPPIVPHNSPKSAFEVVISGGLNGAQVHLQQPRTINRLDTYYEVELEDWGVGRTELALADKYGLRNHGDLEIDEVEINGNITNIAQAALELRDTDIEGDLYNEPSAVIKVEDKVRIERQLATGGGHLENYGTIELTLASELYTEGNFNNAGTIVLHGGACGADKGGSLYNNSAGLIWGFGVVYAGQQPRNEGQIIAAFDSLVVFAEGPLSSLGIMKSVGAGSLMLDHSLDLGNTTIRVEAGTLSLQEAEPLGGSSSITLAGGALTLSDPCLSDYNITLSGGTLEVRGPNEPNGMSLIGFGTIRADLDIDPCDSIELTGPTNIIGDITIRAGATLEISDGQTLITGFTRCKGTIRLMGGTVVFQGGCDCDECNITHGLGTDRNHFDVNRDGAVNLKDFASFADIWLWRASWY